MKKKAEEIKPLEFKINDSVLTPISDRPGRIVKIEEKIRSGAYYGSPYFKEYTVVLTFPCLRTDGDLKISVILSKERLTLLTPYVG